MRASVRGGSGGRGHLRHQSVLYQHSDPAGRIALDHLRRIVDGPVLIGLTLGPEGGERLQLKNTQSISAPWPMETISVSYSCDCPHITHRGR